MACYCLYLFGSPRIELDDREVSISRRKGWALLAYLAVTDQPHSRESLAALFWPELDQSAALANLRRELSVLKSVLGVDLLRVERVNIDLNPDSDVWMDVGEFQHLIAKTQVYEKSSGQLCPECIGTLREAVSLYRDHFMAGFNLSDSPKFDEWQFFQSEGLRQALADGLQKLIRLYVEKDAFEQALEYARLWLSLDLLHEPAHRELMRLYALSGQHSAAMRQYQECERLLREELELTPDEETKMLHATIRDNRRQLQRKEQPAINNLPLQTTTFIGRHKELQSLQNLLVGDRGDRLVTIMGPGGIGKTSLAIEAARSLAERFSDGVCYVSLAGIHSAKKIISTLHDNLGIQYLHYEDDQQEQHLIDYLRDRQMLLVFDNFEHLLDGSILLNKILETASKVRILATSRERLGLTSEHLYTLAGMDYPEHDESKNYQDYDAVELLLQCIRRQLPDFEPQNIDLRALIRICRLVQGMPLALVLAAGWIEALSLDEIADEITHSLDILETELRDLPDRQRSMRAIFDYSWNLLVAEQRQTLMKCCVFQGGFTRHAAQTVAGASIKTLLALINKSWLHRDEEGRYQIHELTRQYIQSKLTQEVQTDLQVKKDHSSYFAGLLVDLKQMMNGPRQKEAFHTLAIEMENIRSAWYWFLEQNQLETAIQKILTALFRYCEARAKPFDLLQLVQDAGKSIENQKMKLQNQAYASLLTAQAAFFWNGYPIRFEPFGMLIIGDEDVLIKAWGMLGGIEDLQAMEFWGIMLTYLYGRLIDYEEGAKQSRELVRHYRQETRAAAVQNQKEQQILNQWNLAFSLELLLHLLLLRYRADARAGEMEEVAEEALEIFQSLGDERETGFTLRLLGHLQRLQHNYPKAIQYWEATQEKLWATGDWPIAADLHWQIGDVYLQLGEFSTAFLHYQANVQAYEERGEKWIVAELLSKESYEALRYSDIEHAWRTRQLSLSYAREVGDRYGEAWGLWELGEIHRVMGEADQAHQNYREAKTQLDWIGDPNGNTFYYRGLGDLALAEKDFEEAEQHFQKSLKHATTSGHAWAMAYALTGAGKATAGMGHSARAKDYFSQALKQAKEADELGITLAVMEGIAELYSLRGNTERALELADLIVKHKVSWRETKDNARAILETLAASEATKSEVDALLQEKAIDVWGEVEKLVRELGDRP